MSSFELIGFTAQSNVNLISAAFTIMVVYLLATGRILSFVDEACKDTSYARAVQSLYKELVVMGFSSFLLTMLISTDTLGRDEAIFILYLGAADVTLFFSAVYHVGLSFALMLNNIRRMRLLRERLSLDIHLLLDKFLSSSGIEKSLWYPFSTVKNTTEFRMLRIMFLKQFNLDRSFDFARYVILSEESHIIEMLETTPFSWGCFLLIICLNFIRNSFEMCKNALQNSLSHYCDSGDRECITATGQTLTMLVICYLFLIVLMVMAFVSRLYTIRLLSINGPRNPNDYPNYILDDEVAEMEENQATTSRMTLEKVKMTLQDLKKCEIIKELRRRAEGHKMSNTIAKTKKLLTMSSFKLRSLRSVQVHEASLGSPGKYATGIRKVLKLPSNLSAKEAPEDSEDQNDPAAENSEAEPKVIQKRRDGSAGGILSAFGRGRRSEEGTASSKMRVVYISYGGIQSGLFLFDSPKVYFTIRDLCNLLLCLLLAFYSTSMISVSLDTKNPGLWNGLILFAMIASIFLQAYIVHASSIINAVSHFHGDVVGKVIEEQENNANLERMIREKVISKVKEYLGLKTEELNESELKKAVFQLFNELQSLDGFSDNLISKDELRTLLQKCNIFFSNDKLDAAFALMDTDQSGEISLSEFNDFIFPQQALENRRKSRMLKLKAKGLWRKVIVEVADETFSGSNPVQLKLKMLFRKKARAVGTVAKVFKPQTVTDRRKLLKRNISVTKEAALIGTSVTTTDTKLYNMMSAHRVALELKRTIAQKKLNASNEVRKKFNIATTDVTLSDLPARISDNIETANATPQGDDKVVEFGSYWEQSNDLNAGTDHSNSQLEENQNLGEERLMLDLSDVASDDTASSPALGNLRPPVNWTEAEYDSMRKSLQSLKVL